MFDNTSSSSFPNDAESKPYVRPFKDDVIIISGVVIFFFLIVGVVLNTITIIVIQSTAALRDVFMFFITSLCVSDLMSALISPLFWYRRTLGFDLWVPPEFFCKLYWSVDLMTTFSTAMHILNFAILRLLSIRHSVVFRRISDRRAKAWISFTWLVAFLCGFLPMAIFTGADPGVPKNRTSGETKAKWPACTVLLDQVEHYKKYSMSSYILFILLPMLMVAIVSPFICRSVHKHTVSSRGINDTAMNKRVQKEKQAVLQLALIVVSFLFGYLPFVTYELWSLSASDPVADYWFGLLQYFCLRLSECMNPIFYNISSPKMRSHTRRYLGRLFSSCSLGDNRTKQATSETGSSDVLRVTVTGL